VIEESKNTYPKSWEVVPLGQFVENEKGKKPKSQKEKPDNIFKYPYVDIEAFEQGIIKSWTNGENCRFCYESDFLMVWDGSRSGLVGKGMDGALGSTLVRINFPEIENSYAYYFLQSKYRQINKRAKGSGTPHVDPDLLWSYEFPIAPLSEQKRIVTKIEELFSELDKGIESLKTAREQLKIYRQAVLKHAFEGKLTADWREENKDKLETIDEMMEHIKQEREAAYQKQLEEWKAAVKAWEKNGKEGKRPAKPKGLKGFGVDESINSKFSEYPDVWGTITINDTSSHIVDCLHSTPKFRDHGKYCVDSTWVENDKIFMEDARYVDEKIYLERIKRLKPQKGDILFVREGSKKIGRVLVVDFDFEFCLGQRMMMFRPLTCILPTFFSYYVQSIKFKKQYKPLIGGSTSPHLNIADIKAMTFPVCSMSEQMETIKEIETLLSVVDEFNVEIDIQIKKSESLRQSILKQAFSGKLVAQDPNDEPASVLLERIREEKSVTKQVTKRALKSKKRNVA